MSNVDEEKSAVEKAETVFITTEVITSKVYKVSPEQKEELDRLAEERMKKAREEAIPKIRKLYEQRVKELRLQQKPKADGEGN
ncbi:hypothetical protein [Paenibacillus nasutitermitis]|uniref:Uncharacterized protein n=1 Tax=Paenibacillus nasutitermitis TaxID=1652958 RepID=A0A917E1G6_9BACL|nr:hypothetical protein [Paenibacillus nasutitermitis]GGD89595.1 hypothetical protein GCM10010911_55270 [Paenibacillus nasutitermitis]